MNVFIRSAICASLLSLAAFSCTLHVRAANSNRLVLSPILQPGQKILYHLHFTTEKKTRSESRVVSPMVPENASADTERLLETEVKSVTGAPAHTQVLLLTHMSQVDGTALAGGDGNVEFRLLDDGRASDVKGLDALSADEQSLWRQWLSQFAFSWTFPAGGIKPGDKWKKEESIVGTALVALVWEKQFEYVRNEPCPQRLDAAGKPQKSRALCAVVVTTSSMKQKSPRDRRHSRRLQNPQSQNQRHRARQDPGHLLYLPAHPPPRTCHRRLRPIHGRHHRQVRRLQPGAFQRRRRQPRRSASHRVGAREINPSLEALDL